LLACPPFIYLNILTYSALGKTVIIIIIIIIIITIIIIIIIIIITISMS
jgi:hypothetical protein